MQAVPSSLPETLVDLLLLPHPGGGQPAAVWPMPREHTPHCGVEVQQDTVIINDGDNPQPIIQTVKEAGDLSDRPFRGHSRVVCFRDVQPYRRIPMSLLSSAANSR